MKKIIILIAGVMLIAASCTVSNPPQSSYTSDSSKVEQTQQKLQAAVPIPDLKTSAERQNIARRAVTFDDENKVTYIYLVNFGKVMAFYTVKGKVSSLNSFLTPLDKLVFDDGKPCNSGSDATNPCYLVAGPDIDGAYGENADGIFFYTTDGAYVEWRGDYMVSDQPLKLTTPPELTREVK